jgi:hypothetical protein
MRNKGALSVAQAKNKQDLFNKKTEKLEELQAPGYKVGASNVLPSKMEARLFRGAIADGNAFKTNIKGAEDIIKENKGVPSSFWSPNVYNSLQQELTKAQLDLKGEAFFKLGVLAGPDMDLIKKTFGQIDSLFGTYQPGNEKVALEKLNSLREFVNNKISSKAGAMGYQRDAQQITKKDIQGLGDAELDALINQYAGQ